MQAVNESDKYRCAPLGRFNMGGDNELVYLPLSRRALLLPKHEVNVLAACAQFKTLERHLVDLFGDTEPAICSLERLSELAAQGAMVGQLGVLNLINEAPTEAQESVRWLAFPTCRRPNQLSTAIRSYAENVARYGHTIRVFVADDSNDRATEQQNERVLLAAAREFGIEVYYAGHDDKVRYIVELAQQGDLPSDVLNFALLGADKMPAIGANRNGILLRTKGTLVLSADDDTVCRTGRSPGSAAVSSLKLGVDGDPTEFWFFQSRDSVLDSVAWTDLDVVAEHERFLGRTVSDVAKAVDGSIPDISSVCSHLLSYLYTAAARIRITYTGVAGDSAMYSGQGLQVSVNPGTRGRLVSSAEAFRIATNSREVLRLAMSPVVSHVSPCITTCVGLDNRDLLPPFFPVCRNEDGIFGTFLESCIGGSFAGHLPWAVLHSPPGARSYQLDAAAASIRMSDVILATASVWAGKASGSPSARLTALGHALTDVAELPESEFCELLRTRLWNAAARNIARQETALRTYAGQPAYWAEHVRRQIRMTSEAVARPDYYVPSDLPGGEESVRAQSLVGQFGQLLRWWPRIVETACVLSAQGKDLGRKLG